jgi:hypothetical protein
MSFSLPHAVKRTKKALNRLQIFLKNQIGQYVNSPDFVLISKMLVYLVDKMLIICFFFLNPFVGKNFFWVHFATYASFHKIPDFETHIDLFEE